MVSRLRAAGLATYKLPERLELLDELPVTASGKVQKHQISATDFRGARPMIVEYAAAPIPGTDGLAATITLNRPAELNAMSWEMIGAFDAAVSQAAADATVRVVFVTGSGRAFSAGGDLKSYVELQRDPVRFPRFVKDLHDAFGRLRKLRVPAIALVNGVTVAGGLELLLNCDFAIAAQSARIGDGHLNFGQMGGGGVLTLLARMIGIARASELVMTGALLDARTAAEWGLVSRVVPDDELAQEGMKLAAQIAGKSPLGDGQRQGRHEHHLGPEPQR